MRVARDSRRYRFYLRGVGFLAALFVRLLGATWRVRFSGNDPFEGEGAFIPATWHHSVLVAAFVWRDRGLAVPVSHSRDGDLMDATLRHLGFAESPRGSSSRGATTLLRAMIRRVRGGTVVGMLPDGPRGPAGQAKPGVIALARSAGVPLVPVGIAAAPLKQFSSWDTARLPLPFAVVHCRYGKPLQVPMKARAEEIESFRLELQKQLDQLDAEMERSISSSTRRGPRRDPAA